MNIEKDIELHSVKDKNIMPIFIQARKMEKINNTQCWQEYGGTGIPVHCWGSAVLLWEGESTDTCRNNHGNTIFNKKEGKKEKHPMAIISRTLV